MYFEACPAEHAVWCALAWVAGTAIIVLHWCVGTGSHYNGACWVRCMLKRVRWSMRFGVRWRGSQGQPSGRIGVGRRDSHQEGNGCTLRV